MARILVVEDENSIRRSTRLNLERAGHTVDEAVDGVHGLERLRASLPDVVIINGYMPRMDGPELARCIKADPELASVVIIADSGDPGMLRRFQEEGVAFVLYRPCRLEQYVDTVAKALESVASR